MKYNDATRTNGRARIHALAALACLSIAPAFAQVNAPPDPLSITGPDPAARYRGISIEQHLNTQVNLGLEFVDETGKPVTLATYFNLPEALKEGRAGGRRA